METDPPLSGNPAAANRPTLNYERATTHGRLWPSSPILFGIAVVVAVVASYSLLAYTTGEYGGGDRGVYGFKSWGVLHYRTIDYKATSGSALAITAIEKWHPKRAVITASLFVGIWVIIFLIRPRRLPSRRRRPVFGAGRGSMTIVSEDDEHLQDFQEHIE